MAEVEKNWDVWDRYKFKSDEDYGLVAAIFKAKGYDPNNPGNACPPTLVFRGTDFDDFREIAIFMPIKIEAGIWWTFCEDPIIVDPRLVRDAYTENMRGGPSGATNSPKITQESLESKGFTSPLYFTELGKFQLYGSQSGASREAVATVTLRIMTKEKGDWTTNVLQGLGKGSKQYEKAINYGKSTVEEKIVSQKDKRLEISGHSLGGGLASAVTMALDNVYKDISFHGMVFNPSGVHNETVKPATNREGLIDVFAVKDEVLTTASDKPTTMPIVGAVFNIARHYIGQYGMPRIAGAVQTCPGSGSGNPLVEKKSYNYPKGAKLPVLFPISGQTLIKNDASTKGKGHPSSEGAGAESSGYNKFPVISGISNAISSAQTVSQVGEAVVAFIVKRYEPQIPNDPIPDNPEFPGSGELARNINYYISFYNKAKAELMKELDGIADIFAACAEYHSMDTVIATYLNKYGESVSHPILDDNERNTSHA